MKVARSTCALVLAVTAAPIGSLSAQTTAASTPAGSVITNVASVSVGSGAGAVSSNPVRTVVAERLDVALAAASPSLSIPRGPSVVRFTLTNAGNGTEAFVLNGQIAGADATIVGFAIDRNDDGVFDPAVDLAIAPNAAIPALPAGGTAKLLIRLQGNTAGAAGTLQIRATAATGSGAPGTVFAGLGDGGSDAVTGPTGAAATLNYALTVANIGGTEGITLVKSQAVSGSNGSVIPAPGAIVTYTLVATFAGASVSPAARLLDPIPANTLYVAGSLSLDGAALSDAADTDAGTFDGSGIAVALGDVAAPATHTVQFKVTIQ